MKNVLRLSKTTLIVIASLSIYACSAPPETASDAPSDSAAPVAFLGVNVIPMDADRVLADQTVIVSGDRIVFAIISFTTICSAD